MALDNPVLADTTPRLGRSSRIFELAVVVGLTVAVVLVAALWGTAPDQEGRTSVGSNGSSLDAASVAASTTAVIDVPVASSVERTATLERAGVNAAAAGRVQASTDEFLIPSQSGVVPGQPDPSTPLLPTSFQRYQVQRGETLVSIASARGVSVSELLRWNWQLEEDSVLIRGEWLWIPEWNQTAVAEETLGSTDEGKSGRGGG